MAAKIVLYTQRVEIIENYGERRDCADQNIPRFIESCGYLPIPVSNILGTAKQMTGHMQPAGIILTGGNSLAKYGGDAPERDEVEEELLRAAMQYDIPVYGFCRGMQVIMDYFGCKLERVEGHVAVRHKISGTLGGIEVNSFHNQGCRIIREPLQVLAQTADGVIEAVQHRDKRILGTMWHPERENPFQISDIQRVKKLFG